MRETEGGRERHSTPAGPQEEERGKAERGRRTETEHEQKSEGRQKRCLRREGRMTLRKANNRSMRESQTKTDNEREREQQ